MGASRLRVLTDVMLLESPPQTFVGLRNGVSLALVIVIVAPWDEVRRYSLSELNRHNNALFLDAA